MFRNFSFLVFVAAFLICESAFVDELQKKRCSVKDNACQKKLYTESLQTVAKTGLPENGIPPFDPYVIKNISVSVLGLVNITMIDGVAKGLKNCYFGRINTTIENYHSLMEIICDVTIKGNYKVLANGPLVENLLGGSTVHGEGFGKVKIEKFRVTFDFDIFLREANDEIYIDCKYEDTHYKYEFGKITFAANNLYIANQEVSNQIVNLLNQNWNFIITTFGKPFVDTAMDIVYELTHKFFDVTPTRYYLLEDLRPYLKN
ncbi:uncharacterized protein LOC126371102 [Pectinophora gossypiella]|uniref:uncharacterized protein LOC126371102 n=1 Tax=Pectinophora gossypiella TaxID=13191 RepID=UPI00214F49DE|nr:uncharacterized protein LOC126371102 [Pectinophora gossypiella]